MTTLTKEQLQQIEAAAKEVLWPVVWSEKKARANFSEKITPIVVLELARFALLSLGTDTPAQPVIPEHRQMVPDDLLLAFDTISRLNNAMYRWTSRMSYNGSYVGEPEGLLKGNIREIEHILDSSRAEMLKAQPVSEPYKLNGWISVDNELPEEGVRVLVFSDGAFVLLAEFTGGEFYDVVRDGEEFFETVTRCVTHWMPLPAAPAQGRE